MISLCVMVCIAVTVAGSVRGAELQQGMPGVFPSGHNQERWPELRSKFATTQRLKANPQTTATICNADVFSDADEGAIQCAFHWCSADNDLTDDAAQDTVRQCWRRTTWVDDSAACGEVLVTLRIASRLPLPPSFWIESSTAAARQLIDVSSADVKRDHTFREIVPLALEHWETGRVAVRPFFAAKAQFRNKALNNKPSCKAEVICFFGADRCELSGWDTMGHSNLTSHFAKEPLTSSWSPSQGPRLLGDTAMVLVPPRKRFDVTVLWGLLASRATPLIGAVDKTWQYDPGFEPQDPWAQRALYQLCKGLPANLLILGQSACWIERFREQLQEQEREKFPTRNFDTRLGEFLGRDSKAKEDIWIVGGRMKACKYSFQVNIAIDIPAQLAVEYKSLWDFAIAERNAAASWTANRAWHTAALWVRAEAEVVIIGSTQDTVIISAVCAWVGMLVFTADPYLSSLVLLLVLGVISGLAFFMIVIMNWSIGAIEVVSLVIFVGYSVTYTLHVAHNFSEVRLDDPMLVEALDRCRSDHGEPFDSDSKKEVAAELQPSASEVRTARVRVAILRVGCATLSSAASTALSSMFLLGTTLNIFCKLGAVVIAVTLLSIFCALVSLPAVLMVCGPGPDLSYRRCLINAAKATKDWFRNGGPFGDENHDEPLVAGYLVEAYDREQPCRGDAGF